MATMPAESVLSEDGGRTAGEVAPGVTLVKNVRVPVRDGTRLAADVYFPTAALESGNAVSLVMEYIPYRKDEVDPRPAATTCTSRSTGTRSRASTSAAPAPRRAQHCDEYMLQEQLDGVDAVEWLAGQPWCDGHVNMMGISYGGFTALQIASAPAAAPDEHHPDVLHRRPLHRRLPLPRRAACACTTTSGRTARRWSPGTRCRRTRSGRDDWAEVWQEHLDEQRAIPARVVRHQVDVRLLAQRLGRASGGARSPAPRS